MEQTFMGVRLSAGKPVELHMLASQDVPLHKETS